MYRQSLSNSSHSPVTVVCMKLGMDSSDTEWAVSGTVSFCCSFLNCIENCFWSFVLMKFWSAFEFFNSDTFPARLYDKYYALLRLLRGEHGRKLLHICSHALKVALLKWKCCTLLNSPLASDWSIKFVHLKGEL